MGEQRKRNYLNLRLIIGLGVLYGVILLIVKYTFHLEGIAMQKVFGISGVILLLTSMVAAVYDSVFFASKINKINLILQKEKEPKQYIEELEKLSRKRVSYRYQSVLTMNLSVGYSELGEYKKALELLHSIHPFSLIGLNQAIYYMNEASYYFLDSEEERAITILKEQENLFTQFPKQMMLVGPLAINQVYRYFHEDNLEQVKIQIHHAEQFCKQEYLKDEINYLKSYLAIYECHLQEARERIQGLKEKKLLPSLKKRLEKLEAEYLR